MEINDWIEGYKVRSFPWVDGKTIYFNVQYYAPGQSIARLPVWDKTVYITDNAAGRNMITNFLDSIVNYVAGMQIQDGYKVILTA